jgi:hypothetical protein
MDLKREFGMMRMGRRQGMMVMVSELEGGVGHEEFLDVVRWNMTIAEASSRVRT